MGVGLRVVYGLRTVKVAAPRVITINPKGAETDHWRGTSGKLRGFMEVLVAENFLLPCGMSTSW